MRTRQELAAHLAAGNEVEWLFFWGHTQKKPDVVDASCLSQWFPRAFELEGVRYASAEHWMMAEKARLFGDDDAVRRAIDAKSPAEAKIVGRTVQRYDDAKWGAHRFEAVVRGNIAKFGTHADLGAFLRATGRHVLVEAAPRDRIWGIGMGAANPDARDPSRWRGYNLLGFALMEARQRLAGRGTERASSVLR